MAINLLTLCFEYYTKSGNKFCTIHYAKFYNSTHYFRVLKIIDPAVYSYLKTLLFYNQTSGKGIRPNLRLLTPSQKPQVEVSR